VTGQSLNNEDAELSRLRTAFSANPKSEVFAALVDRLCELGKADEAEQICRKGLVFLPNSLDGLTALAHVHLVRGRLENATAQLIKVLDSDDEHPEAIRRLGQVLLKRGDRTRARIILEYAESLLPGDGGIADLLVQAGGVPSFRARRSPSVLRPLTPPVRSPDPAGSLEDDPTVITPTEPPEENSRTESSLPAVVPVVKPLESLAEIAARRSGQLSADRPAPVSGMMVTSRLAELSQKKGGSRTGLYVGIGAALLALGLVVALWGGK
jgi:tetratricopeptide (TPR) repeat protein